MKPLFFLILLAFSSCATSGSTRSYIISHTETPEFVIDEEVENEEP